MWRRSSSLWLTARTFALHATRLARAHESRRPSRRPARGLLRLAHGLDLLQRITKVRHVLERAVDGGKANVGDLVEPVELFHHHLAQLPRRDLALALREHALHDAIDGRVDEFGGHRPLVQRPREADAQSIGVEVGAVAVRLDDLRVVATAEGAFHAR